MVSERSFELYCPTKVKFGVGVSSEAGEEIKKLNGQKVLVVVDPGVVAAGVLENILKSLEKENLPYIIFDEVEVNATLSKVHKASDLQKKEGCDILLCVGGGSTIDTGKGVGCLATNPGPLQAYEGPEKYNNPPLPSVAIPTTAGTGSELSFGAVLYDEERNYKFSFRSSMQIPKVALLDPLLLKSLPPSVAASSGMDALSHCVEAFVSKWSTYITDAYCKQNFHLVGQYLRRFVANPSDVEAAGGMLQASAMGSMAFNTARLGLVHAMASPLGVHFHLPHGTSCGVLMPPVIRYNLIACPEKYIEIAIALEGSVKGTRKMEQAYSAIDAIDRLMADIGLHVHFDSAQIVEEKLSQMADETLSSGMQLTNPRNVTKEDVIGVYRDFFGI
ncbi:MAG: iron-containing alcohol dehydrogenase [Deltaproteobacteria bacterium]|nr:iron-containing alcohol dehydrogenase [Deltaproteobacteria bacterium]MBW2153958.1 iron-containing alcohol dehydrogenase [Deltaproteobacteria bacterium]